MFDFVRIACVVPQLRVGDVEYNLSHMLGYAEKAEAKKADYVVFPELCLTGYTCGDLFFQNALQTAAINAVGDYASATSEYGFTSIIGAPIVIDGQIYNCAVVISGGRIIGIVPKVFIPNYNEFYEHRWFSSGVDLSIQTVSSEEIGLGGGYDIPVGRDLIFSAHGCRFGIEICEDLWTPLPPSTFLAINGAEVIFNLSASNETIAKRKYRRSLVTHQSGACTCAYAYVSSGSGESTTDLVFSGHSAIAENGTLKAENKNLIDSDYMLCTDVDIGRVRADRMKNKCFKDSTLLYGTMQPCRTVTAMPTVARSDGSLYSVEKLPFVPSVKNDRIGRCMEIFEMQVAGLKKRISVTGGKVVIGVSGGLDSTLALLVCVQAMRELGRDVTDVVAITLPCFGTTDRTYNNALLLMERLGVTSKEISIKEACTLHCEDIGHPIDEFDVTFENVQARERTQVLMDYACKIGGFVVGTGDLSELALGWCTYNADHMSMYGVNASIPKTLIRWMIDSISDSEYFSSCSDVLKDVIDTPISPELLPPDEKGVIAQKTEDIIGPYALHDFFLFNMLRYGFSPDKIYALAKTAFSDDFDSDEILKWMKSFYRRFFTQQFKRSCLPDSVKVGSVCLSPRGDWRMPSDASAALWLGIIDKL